MRDLIRRLFDKGTLRGQLLRYGIVGVIAFLVDYGLLWALTEWAGLHYLVSAAIAFSVAFLCNYLLSIGFVFGLSREEGPWKNLASFLLIAVIGLGLNELIMYACSDLLGLHYLLSKIVATVIVFFWNFLARRYLVVRTQKG